MDCLHTDSEDEIFPMRPSVKALSQRRVVKKVDDGALCSCEIVQLAVVPTRPPMEGEVSRSPHLCLQ
jgi:hypothetical protein